MVGMEEEFFKLEVRTECEEGPDNAKALALGCKVVLFRWFEGP